MTRSVTGWLRKKRASKRQKQQNGRYCTKRSPFRLKAFRKWARAAGLATATVLEPFAGDGDIIMMLTCAKLCSRFAAYDINPGAVYIMLRDTLARFLRGYKVCISNPPWRARNSARRMGLEFPVPARYDDIYKYALELALKNCRYVAFLLPASFLRSGLFRDRLSAYVLIEQNLFSDTSNPTCLALFTPRPRSTEIWIGDEHIGTLADLEAARNAHAPAKSRKRGANGMRFNASDGKLGLVCVDSINGLLIRFCHGYELSHRNVRRSDRAITRIDVDFEVTPEVLDRLNAGLARYRKDTRDLFLAPFKGLRKDGRYRRRLDYQTARWLIATYA